MPWKSATLVAVPTACACRHAGSFAVGLSVPQDCCWLVWLYAARFMKGLKQNLKTTKPQNSKTSKRQNLTTSFCFACWGCRCHAASVLAGLSVQLLQAQVVWCMLPPTPPTCTTLYDICIALYTTCTTFCHTHNRPCGKLGQDCCHGGLGEECSAGLVCVDDKCQSPEQCGELG